MPDLGELAAVGPEDLRWARWAYAEVEAWPEDLSQLDVIAEFAKVVSVAGGPWPDRGMPGST